MADPGAGITLDELWERVPGATADDLDRWRTELDQRAAQAEIDISNAQLAGGQAGHVVVVLPKHEMTPTEAVVHATWLILVAEAADPDLDVEAIRRAVLES